MIERANWCWLLLLLVFAGCSSERVVLLPSADGQPSAVVVRDRYGEQVLDRPFSALALGRAGNRFVYVSSPEDLQRRFGAAIAALPTRPRNLTLYFESDSDTLTKESEATLVQLCREIDDRPNLEITVIGHTDRVGSDRYNDRLSERRAQKVLGALRQASINSENIEVLWRGEREQQVETADGVEEAMNRRVEIGIR